MTVSVHEPFRSMAAAVAGKYVEMAGGSVADVSAVTASVSETVGRVSAGAPEDATIDLAFQPNGRGLQVTVVCGARSVVVRHPLLAEKG
jgi:hypothetical protein